MGMRSMTLLRPEINTVVNDRDALEVCHLLDGTVVDNQDVEPVNRAMMDLLGRS